MNSGIYAIRNIITNDFYIGQSIKLKHRWYSHCWTLAKKKHPNIHMQRAYEKYGANSLVFEIMLYCEPDELTYYEQSLVDKLRPAYNIAKECVGTTRGIKLSAETRALFSQQRRGVPKSEEANRKNALAHLGKLKGKKHTEEHNRKIALAGIGRKHTEEELRKMSIGNKGKVISDERRETARRNATGKHPSEETRRKMSLAHTGRKHTEEAIQKIRLAHQKRRADKRDSKKGD